MNLLKRSSPPPQPSQQQTTPPRPSAPYGDHSITTSTTSNTNCTTTIPGSPGGVSTPGSPQPSTLCNNTTLVRHHHHHHLHSAASGVGLSQTTQLLLQMGGENSAFKAIPNHRMLATSTSHSVSSPACGYDSNSSSDSEEINVNDHTDDEEEGRARLLSLQQHLDSSRPHVGKSSPKSLLNADEDDKAEPLQLTKYDRDRLWGAQCIDNTRSELQDTVVQLNKHDHGRVVTLSAVTPECPAEFYTGILVRRSSQQSSVDKRSLRASESRCF